MISVLWLFLIIPFVFILGVMLSDPIKRWIGLMIYMFRNITGDR
jgi:hypothetical protein